MSSKTKKPLKIKENKVEPTSLFTIDYYKFQVDNLSDELKKY